MPRLPNPTYNPSTMNDDDDITTFPILTPRQQGVLIDLIESVLDCLDEAFQRHKAGIYDLGDTISGASEALTDFLLEIDSFRDRDSLPLGDFMAACVISIAQAPGPHHDKEAETLIPACFTPRYRAIVLENEAALMTIAEEVVQLYKHDEADPPDIVPFTVDRFCEHLTAKGVKVSQAFRRAVTDYVLLGTLYHLFLNR